MTEQKAIDELNSCHAFGLSSECRSLAKLALEKQIPKKMESYYCPVCRHYFEDGEEHNYCPACGQKLEDDW